MPSLAFILTDHDGRELPSSKHKFHKWNILQFLTSWYDFILMEDLIFFLQPFLFSSRTNTDENIQFRNRIQTNHIYK